MDVEGYVRTVSQKVESCSQQDVELHVEQVLPQFTSLIIVCIQSRISMELCIKLLKHCYSHEVLDYLRVLLFAIHVFSFYSAGAFMSCRS